MYHAIPTTRPRKSAFALQIFGCEFRAWFLSLYDKTRPVNELFDASKPTVAVGRSSCARQCGMMERSTTTLDYGCNASYLLWETMQTDREADTLDYGLHLTSYLGQSSRLLPCMKIYRFTAAFSVCWKIWNGSEFCINVERCSQR